MAKYKNLIVWQKANELAIKVYKLTEDFPKKETFGITAQIRRAVLSVPTNIVEGYGRRTKIELSSISEIQTLIEEVSKLLWNLQKLCHHIYLPKRLKGV